MLGKIWFIIIFHHTKCTMFFLEVLPENRTVWYSCMKIMDLRFLLCTVNLTQNKNMVRTSKLSSKVQRYKYQRRLLSSNHTGMSRKMHHNLTKFMKEISSYWNGQLTNKNLHKSHRERPTSRLTQRFWDWVLILWSSYR